MTAWKGWKLVLLLWLGVVMLASTSEVGHFAEATFDQFFKEPAKAVGISTKKAQKICHVVLFAVLGSLLAFSTLPPRSPWVRGVVWSFAIGTISEIAQIPFVGRTPRIFDVILNGVTGSLACWFWLYYSSRRALES